MAKKRYRWVCPNCDKGALGPQRPRKNNVVRYCLPCSSKAGVLVERTCPSLEKRRSARKAKVTKKAKRKRDSAKARRDELWVYQGWDLEKELTRMCKHPELNLRRKPVVEIRRRKQGNYCTGRSYGGRIVLTIPTEATAGQALALLAHEVAHEDRGARGHGERWRTVFTTLAEDLYGAEITPTDSHYHLHINVRNAIGRALVVPQEG